MASTRSIRVLSRALGPRVKGGQLAHLRCLGEVGERPFRGEALIGVGRRARRGCSWRPAASGTRRRPEGPGRHRGWPSPRNLPPMPISAAGSSTAYLHVRAATHPGIAAVGVPPASLAQTRSGEIRSMSREPVSTDKGRTNSVSGREGLMSSQTSQQIAEIAPARKVATAATKSRESASLSVCRYTIRFG
jgi:hypothetical protein